jgi:hypothetical protein
MIPPANFTIERHDTYFFVLNNEGLICRVIMIPEPLDHTKFTTEDCK